MSKKSAELIKRARKRAAQMSSIVASSTLERIVLDEVGRLLIEIAAALESESKFYSEALNKVCKNARYEIRQLKRERGKAKSGGVS